MVGRFLDESREYALKAEGVLLETVKAAGAGGITLKEACAKAKPGLGDWPADKDGYAAGMCCGHLQRLASLGYVRMSGDRPVRYTYEEMWLGLR
jgi:hypothetical protein